MKEPFASIYPQAIEAALRERGPVAVLRDVMQAMLKVRPEVPQQDLYAYMSLVWELQALLVRQACIQPLQEGLDVRVKRAA